MPQQAKAEQYHVTWLIRRLFRAMAQNATDRLTALDLTVADRAVLEFLYPDEALTVPDMASRYQVSRQHIQVTANGLLDRKLITAKPNPAHKRSSLIALTAKGRQLFARIKQDDEKQLARIFTGTARQDVAVTRETLQKILDQLQ